MVFEIVLALFLQKLHVPITTRALDVPRLPLQGRTGQGYNWINGMMEYWNVDFKKGIFPFYAFFTCIVKKNSKQPIIPPFHSSTIPNVSEAI